MSLKKSTGLVKLPVCQNPEYVLKTLYSKLARVLSQFPEDSAYRKYTEETVASRLFVVEKANCVTEIEEKINSGQAEELILQAERELQLARSFLYSRPWEPLIAEPPADQWKWPPYRIA